jgi:hypothetical protein
MNSVCYASVPFFPYGGQGRGVEVFAQPLDVGSNVQRTTTPARNSGEPGEPSLVANGQADDDIVVPLDADDLTRHVCALHATLPKKKTGDVAPARDGSAQRVDLG